MMGMEDALDAEHWTVGDVSRRLHVTVRTLHHWDAIGLAPASRRSAGGYRRYTADDVERLQRIVVYRELGVGLERVRAILEAPPNGVLAALQEQLALVDARIDRLHGLRRGLERMITAHERGPVLSDEQQSAIFGSDWDPDWAANARARFGDTKQWRQYAERSAARGPAEWQEITGELRAFELELASAMDTGVVPGSAEASRLVDRQRELFAVQFPLTRQMQVCLGRLYESDAGFAEHYDSIRPGLASWFRRIVDDSARSHGIDPDAARWE